MPEWKQPIGRSKPACRGAFTLVELLVVVSIIGALVALLLPAVNAAREASRGVACKSNLKEFGVGMAAHADKFGTYCSGAFDWQRDGAVTEYGWVADMVNSGQPVGRMLCASNPGQVSAAYLDLFNLDTTSLPAFANPATMLGHPPKTAPDGSIIQNPCGQIMAGPLPPGSAQRVQVVQNLIFGKFYNTNYTASWWLVRSGAVLDANGNLQSSVAGVTPALSLRQSTLGPLSVTYASASKVSASCLPLLACGASTTVGGTPIATLPVQLGLIPPGTPMVMSFTPGPVANPNMQPLPSFSAGTPYNGPSGWWAASPS